MNNAVKATALSANALSLWQSGVEYLHRYGQEEEPACLSEIERALRREVHQQAQDLERI